MKRDSTAKVDVSARQRVIPYLISWDWWYSIHYSTLTIHTKTKEGFNGKDGRHSFSIMLFLTKYHLHRNKTKQNKTKVNIPIYNGFSFIWTNWVIIKLTTLLYNRIIRVIKLYLKQLLSGMYNMLWWKW